MSIFTVTSRTLYDKPCEAKQGNIKIPKSKWTHKLYSKVKYFMKKTSLTVIGTGDIFSCFQ